MTDKMNLETFIRLFDNDMDAIDYIFKAHDDGKVETIEYTLPYYTLVSPSKPQTDTGSEYDRLAQPPRFISYACSTQVHSYEVRIADAEHGDIVVEFPFECYKSMTWFNSHLINRLSDGWGDIESHELNITDPYDLECSALALQREINFRRIHNTRQTITGNAYVTIEQFEQNCRDVVNLLDENKAITERIEYINDVQSIAQLA